MFITERIISFLAPHYCRGCGCEGLLVCDWCYPDFASVLPDRCVFCRKATPESQVCPPCRRRTGLRHVWVRTSYDDLPKQLLAGLKLGRQSAAAPHVAKFMVEALPFLSEDMVVVYVPTVTEHIRVRGYEHALLIAQPLAKLISRPLQGLLVRDGQRQQVGSSRKDRLTQLEGAFSVPHPEEVNGAHVLLVDDVFTTGGTLISATKTLRAAGAKSVDAVMFAQKE